MKIFRHVILVILFYILFSFIGIGLFVFFTSSVPEDLSEFARQYRFYEAVLVFFKLLPSLLLAAFLVGLSWSFGRADSKNVDRFSSIRVVFFKNVLALSLICIVLSLFASEVLSPLIRNKQENMAENERNYENYLYLAEQSLFEEDYIYAKYYIDNALALKPNEKDALDLNDTIDVFYLGIKQQIRKQQKEALAKEIPTSVQDYGYTSFELMEKAKKAFASEAYFDAHYYASLLLEVSEKNNGNRQEAQQLASDAWNKLQDNPRGINSEQAEVYELKRLGYFSFMNKEYEKAYYLFSDLAARYPSDLDIGRYFALSKEQMDQKYFFASEVDDLLAFEQYKDVYFSVKKPDGGFYVLYWKGGTAKQKTGNLIQYLRELNVFSYDRNDSLEYAFSVPYAKLIAFPLEHSPESMQKHLQVGAKKVKKASQFLPLIYLFSTDDEKDGAYIGPKFSYEKKLGENDFKSLLLPMPFEDFIQISQVSLGKDLMPLFSLASFAKKSDSYGFSKEIFYQTFMGRMNYPFVLLIVFILFAGISWNYKLGSKTHFKFKWLITLPLFTIIIYYVLQTVIYILNLFAFVLIGIFSSFAAWVYIGLLCFFVLLSAILFSALRSD